MSSIIPEIDTTNEQLEVNGVRGAGLPERLPATVCESWCQDGNGHVDAWCPDDQWCHSEPRRVSLARYPLITWDDGTKSQNYMQATLGRNYEGRPFISLGHGDDTASHLTPDEAQRLAETLIQLVATARA